MSKTLPPRSAAESGGELSHAVAPPREGSSPSIGNGTAAGCLAASKSLFIFIMYAFHMVGCVGNVPLHHSGRRHRSASVSHVVREATGSRPRPPTRLADGGDRAQDHVRDHVWLRDHDRVRALDLGDRRPGALGYG